MGEKSVDEKSLGENWVDGMLVFVPPFSGFFLNDRDEGAWMDLDIIDMICIFFPRVSRWSLSSPSPLCFFTSFTPPASSSFRFDGRPADHVVRLGFRVNLVGSHCALTDDVWPTRL